MKVDTNFIMWQAVPKKYRTMEFGEYRPNSYSIGDKVAQLVIIPYPKIEFEEVEVFGNDDRGGFGTTGVN